MGLVNRWGFLAENLKIHTQEVQKPGSAPPNARLTGAVTQMLFAPTRAQAVPATRAGQQRESSNLYPGSRRAQVEMSLC